MAEKLFKEPMFLPIFMEAVSDSRNSVKATEAKCEQNTPVHIKGQMLKAKTNLVNSRRTKLDIGDLVFPYYQNYFHIK